MKKHILTCFLASLCLIGSTLTAQVADSPGADFLHRSSPQLSPEKGDTHRSGEIRSDTLPDNYGLVDHSVAKGQESESSSASVGALIYGELIDPDTTVLVELTLTPYYLDSKSAFLRKEYSLEPKKGEFFDGVLNPRTRKFSVYLELGKRPGYFSLSVSGYPVLDNYLIASGDSLKISLNTSLMEVLFAGEDAGFYEAQYAISREQKRGSFAQPRQLVVSKNSTMLQNPENQANLANFKDQFGSELLVLEPGKESLEYLLKGLENGQTVLAPQLSILESYADQLSPAHYELLEAKIICDFYAAGFASYRKFYHPMVERKFGEEDRIAYRHRIRKLMEESEEYSFQEGTRLVSASYLDMALENTILKAIWKEESFLNAVGRSYEGEVADKLQAAYLSQYLSALSGQERQIKKFLEVTEASPWKDRILSLERSHIPGDSILPVGLLGVDGQEYSREDILGTPTLLYFYFSTCAHSAHYFKEFLFPLYQQTKELGYRLIAISVDKDQGLWKSRIDEYSDHSLLNLNLTGEDKEHWRRYYEIYAYPKTMLLDEQGRIVSFDIRNLGMNYQSLHDGFVELYTNEISSPTLSAPQ